jgi:16S rRNA pseudouridine516 synthase
MRLDKYLADMSVGTRLIIRNGIRKGSVTVEGKTVRDPGARVLPESRVTWEGEPVIYHEYEYYMLNKPAGVVTATEDRYQPTVLDLISGRTRRDLFPVGRLDKDTEGLLLITNDGLLAHRLLSPKSHVDKTYFARVQGIVTEEDAARFAEGLAVDEEFTAMPARLVILRSDGEISEVRITIQEGKFHEIKRMFHAVGKEVVSLKRLSMGPISLDPALPPGGYRPLTAGEIKLLEAEENPGSETGAEPVTQDQEKNHDGKDQ